MTILTLNLKVKKQPIRLTFIYNNKINFIPCRTMFHKAKNMLNTTSNIIHGNTTTKIYKRTFVSAYHQNNSPTTKKTPYPKNNLPVSSKNTENAKPVSSSINEEDTNKKQENSYLYNKSNLPVSCTLPQSQPIASKINEGVKTPKDTPPKHPQVLSDALAENPENHHVEIYKLGLTHKIPTPEFCKKHNLPPIVATASAGVDKNNKPQYLVLFASEIKVGEVIKRTKNTEITEVLKADPTTVKNILELERLGIRLIREKEYLKLWEINKRAVEEYNAKLESAGAGAGAITNTIKKLNHDDKT